MSIRVEHLSKTYSLEGCYALQDISFHVGTGITGLLGPNGAGKTTLIYILTSIIRPSSGRALVNGFDTVTNAPAVRKSIGIVPQGFSLYPNMAVVDFLDYMAILSRCHYPKSKLVNVLGQVGLDSLAKKKIHTLSGGIKQRLVIAQALIHDPPVLLINEPTAGLDPAERVRFRNLFCEIALKKTVLLSTHIIEDIVSLTDRVMLLDHGQMKYNGQVSDLIKQAEGKLWGMRVDLEDWDQFRERYKVISFHQVASHRQIEARFTLNDHPVPLDADIVAPTFEDSYLISIAT